jgi:hypothetical protein
MESIDVIQASKMPTTFPNRMNDCTAIREALSLRVDKGGTVDNDSVVVLEAVLKPLSWHDTAL